MSHKKPNILLIMTDQQRWDTICGRTSCRTPNLNRLAEDGVLFQRSYTPVSICCPARAMLLSGAYGWHNGVLNQVHVPESVSPGMAPGTVTYAMRLRNAGYQTGYAGKWHADFNKGPFDYGYSRVTAPTCYSSETFQRGNFSPEDLPEVNAQKYPCSVHSEKTIKWPGGHPWPVWRQIEGPLEGREQYFVASRSIDLLNDFVKNDKPWLLEVHFQEPHDPFQPHVEYARRYNWEDIPLPDNWNEEFVNKPGMNRKEASNYNQLTEEDVKQAIAHYWAYNEELDDNIGRILNCLEASGQSGETLVVFTTDHGEMLGNHHMFLKGWQPYEESHRIPTIARWPQLIKKGKVAEQLMQLHDWAHTFCEIGGAEPLPYNDGESLLPILKNVKGEPSRKSIMNAYYGGEFLYTQRILITERYKYVFNGFDIDELYDFDIDPGEIHNLIDDDKYSETAQKLRNELYRQMDRLEDPYHGTWLYHAGRYLKHTSE